jgi:hypothetical protein
MLYLYPRIFDLWDYKNTVAYFIKMSIRPKSLSTWPRGQSIIFLNNPIFCKLYCFIIVNNFPVANIYSNVQNNTVIYSYSKLLV